MVHHDPAALDAGAWRGPAGIYEVGFRTWLRRATRRRLGKRVRFSSKILPRYAPESRSPGDARSETPSVEPARYRAVPPDRIGVLMDGTNRGDSDLGLLSTGELGARRAAARRRRRRRRLGSLAVLALALVAVVLIVLPGGSSTPGRAAGPTRSAPMGASAPPARLPRHARRAAYSEARAIDRVLAHTSYVQFAHGRRRDVALTFDDGPGQFTGAILRILRRSHTPATFFVIGRLARAYRQLVATEARDGFEVGDHTETHPFLSELSGAEQAAEIRDAG